MKQTAQTKLKATFKLLNLIKLKIFAFVLEFVAILVLPIVPIHLFGAFICLYCTWVLVLVNIYVHSGKFSNFFSVFFWHSVFLSTRCNSFNFCHFILSRVDPVCMCFSMWGFLSQCIKKAIGDKKKEKDKENNMLQK